MSQDSDILLRVPGNAVSSLLDVLMCPACGSALSAGAAGFALVCSGCGRETPIVGGIPRFVRDEDYESGPGDAARRTRESFGYEWTHFNDWQQSGETNFRDYFEGVPLESLRGKLVLDAGCGMGRHARQIAKYAGRVIAVDFSRAIDQAARNVADLHNVECIQADLLALPFPNGSFDYVYSLGVLHHLRDTERALARLVERARPGGRLRVYLYWKLHGWRGALLSIATAARVVTTRMPFPVLRICCRVLSILLYTFIIIPYRVLSELGVKSHESWPLFAYTKYPFNVLYNDQFDRFSAPIEKRYDADDVRRMLESAGLRDVIVRPCFGWIAEGTRPIEK